MGAKERRVKYGEEFRREIFDTARELIIRQGYEEFSMYKLAERIEYSPMTIYHYFKDKDDLLFSMCEEVAEQFFVNLTDIVTAYDDPLEALRQALLYLIAFGSTNPDEYNFFFITGSQVYGSVDEFMEKESMARNSYFVFREIVKHCVETGKLQEIDIDVLTQVFTVAIQGLSALSIYKTSYPWFDRKVLAHTLVEGLLRGYGNYPRTDEGHPERKQ